MRRTPTPTGAVLAPVALSVLAMLLSCSARAERTRADGSVEPATSSPTEKSTPPPQPEPKVSPTDCEVTLSVRTLAELREAIDGANPGAVLCVPPGHYEGTLGFSHDVVLRGLGAGPADTVVDAGGLGPVLKLREEDISVRVENMTLRGGEYRAGGVAAIDEPAKLHLVDCVLQGSIGSSYGGGALFASAGEVILERCRLTGNEGGYGGAILADKASRWTLTDCTIEGNTAERGGAIAARWLAHVRIVRSTITGNEASEAGGAAIWLSGTADEGPTLEIVESRIDGGTEPIVDSSGGATITR